MSELLRLPNTHGVEVEDAKSELRRVIREHRRSRTPKELANLGADLVDHGIQAVGNARTVALYVSTEFEPPTIELMDALHSRGVRILLPALGPGLERRWSEYLGSQDLTQRAPGRPPEPTGPTYPAEAIAQAEVVITPALAIDGFGNRLGQGGGWYDRMLTLITPGTPTYAMVFDEELITTQELPRDEHDIPIQAVITPTRVFLIEGSRFERDTKAAAGAVESPVR